MSDQSFQQLKEIVIHLPKSKILAGESNENGRYRFYLSSKKMGKIDLVTTNKDAIIMGDGGVASIAFATGEYSYSSHNFGFYSKTEYFLTEYLFRALEQFLQIIDYKGFVGSGIKNIDKTFLFDLYIQKISLHKQKKIASILTSVDEVIENTQKQIDKLQNLKKATMNELLTKGIGHTEFKDSELGRIPKNWELARLNDVVSAPICYGIVQVGEFVPDGVPVIAIKNLGNISLSNLNRTSTTIESRYERSRVKPDDLLISIKGTIGRLDIVPTYFAGNISRDIARLRFSEKILSEFCLEFLESSNGKRLIEQTSVGTTREELSIHRIKEMSIPVPPIMEQHKIISVSKSLSEKISVSDNLLEKTQSLKKSLMQGLLTGKVRVKVS